MDHHFRLSVSVADKLQGLLFMTESPLYGSNTTWSTCCMARNSDVHLYPFFWKYFHEILKSEETLLTYYRWYDWLTEGREIRSDRKWLSYYQPMAAIFLKKRNFINSKWVCGHFWLFSKISPSQFPLSYSRVTLPSPDNFFSYRFFKLIKNDESFNMTKRFVGTSLEFKKCWLI